MNFPYTDNQIHFCLATCSQDALHSYPNHSTDQIKAQKHGWQGQLRPGSTGPPPQAQSILPAMLALRDMILIGNLTTQVSAKAKHPGGAGVEKRRDEPASPVT